MRTTNLRGGRLSSRPFYTTVFLLSLLAAYSFLAQTQRPRGSPHEGSLLRRSDEPECSAVHHAKDQCAFVTQYCSDEDAGLLPYLRLYYCGLGKAQPVGFAILVVWLGMLFTTIGIAASDFFSVNLSTVATILGLSESLAGVTFLAFGNGSPDVFSTFAAMSSNSASMAVGELIGAASFITGVVAGSMALVREFKVDRRTYARDICFFIVAVAFTMVFLADGHLHFWECCAMIGYYVVYVVTVVLWHWYTKRRTKRLRREGEARSHVYGTVGYAADELAGEPYRDDPDDHEGLSPTAMPSNPDLSALENGPRIEIDGHAAESGDEDTDREHERLVAAEVASSMRVLRTRGKRSSTMTPIRPSLVGALEFRSALAQLQRESNLRLSDIPERSYSGHNLGRSGRGRANSVVPGPTQQSRATIAGPHELHHRRDRALSSGDAPASAALSEDLLTAGRSLAHSSLAPPERTSTGQRTPSPTPSYTVRGSLAPPRVGPLGTAIASPEAESPEDVDLQPKLSLHIPSRRSSHSDRSSPGAPFPRYTDSPMVATPHAQPGEFIPPGPTRRESSFADLQGPTEDPRPVRWWPYAVLPPPHVLLATLFPTIQGWREKTHWDRLVSAISAPSIFLLVTTLPVVETETTVGSSLADTFVDIPASPGLHHAPPISIEPAAIEPETETEWQRYRRRTLTRGNSYNSSSSSHSPLISMENEDTLVDAQPPAAPAPPDVAVKPVSDAPSTSNGNEDVGWSRWLVCVQLFTGPQFAMFILWANISGDWEEPGKGLARMILYTLIVSLVLLAALMLFTSEQKRPKYHFLLCFLGFVISIAWISTIAGEVVGVLKAFGVILGISEALLGLTIFAAGNSVGDLVADITVARLGYPVMALSACFGGPMLNILLGIGIGGVIMMVEKANSKHSKNPDRPYEYQPYRVKVGGTLMISAITLLVILVGLLVAVPMNKWILSRKIGWVLIGLWTLSTVVNVIVELTGMWADVA